MDVTAIVVERLALAAGYIHTEVREFPQTDIYKDMTHMYNSHVQSHVPELPQMLVAASFPVCLVFCVLCLVVCCRYLVSTSPSYMYVVDQSPPSVNIAVFRKAKQYHEHIENPDNLAYTWSVFDLAKTAYEPGHTEAVIRIVERLHYDVNTTLPMNGLSLFLCACLSGKRELINYMMTKGAGISVTTKEGDTALYLATFGVLGSPNPDFSILEDLIKAGCNVNSANLNGYTPLHRAAGHGNLAVIQTLLKHGADPYQASASGIYPIDSAINAGHLDAAELLKVNIANPHVWDVVDPHTPVRIRLGLQSPQRKHLMESSRRTIAPRIV